ncbi:MAG: 2-oxoglutarate dehydrogenase, E2 component, dihydrolipoamide succinyltransferase [Gemmatimonadaceae bacterium]|nr:2-oxoglutarate dehydrogenase, E2 component, dihydrolipoamide succinyltransferase [Gemmatimonadaceae bacterium]
MARVDVIMPQMGESIAEGTLSKWVKQIGDAVKRDETIFEISTDKVDAEIPAPAAGVLAEILVQPGQTVPVGTVVARLETDAASFVAGAAPAPAAAPTASAPAASASAASAPAPSAPAAPAHPAGSLEERLRTKSSPLVRKMAAEAGVDITTLKGSGIAGRVTKKDLVAALESGAASAKSGTPAVAPAPGASHFAPAGIANPGNVSPTPLPEPWPGDRVESMSKIRAITSYRMVESKHTSAHVTSVFEVDLTRISRLRAARKREFEQAGVKLTYLPFIVQAVCSGLRQYPVLNAAVRGSEIIYRNSINIGLAVALDWGLIVPVLKRADELSLLGLGRGINDLAERARTKKLTPDEVQGGTFSITNYGVKGSLIGTPIIPQPQVAILGLGAIEKRPKVVTGPDGEDTIAIRTCAYFALSFDHRIIDGADADSFLTHVKKTCEAFPEA